MARARGGGWRLSAVATGGVGETIQLEPDARVPPGGDPEKAVDPALRQARTVTVVGVARDVPGFRITDVKEAGVFFPASLDVPKTSIVARVQGPPSLAREALLDRLTIVDSNLGNIVTLQTVARVETFFLQIAFWVAVILGGLALLMLGQATRPVAGGLIAGAGLAASLAAAVLATRTGAYIAEILHVTDPVAYGVSLAVIVASCLGGGVDARRACVAGRSHARASPGVGRGCQSGHTSFDFLIERRHTLLGCQINNPPRRRSCAARSTSWCCGRSPQWGRSTGIPSAPASSRPRQGRCRSTWARSTRR